MSHLVGHRAESTIAHLNTPLATEAADAMLTQVLPQIEG